VIPGMGQNRAHYTCPECGAPTIVLENFSVTCKRLWNLAMVRWLKGMKGKVNHDMLPKDPKDDEVPPVMKVPMGKV